MLCFMLSSSVFPQLIPISLCGTLKIKIPWDFIPINLKTLHIPPVWLPPKNQSGKRNLIFQVWSSTLLQIPALHPSTLLDIYYRAEEEIFFYVNFIPSSLLFDNSNLTLLKSIDCFLCTQNLNFFSLSSVDIQWRQRIIIGVSKSQRTIA